MMGKNPFGRDSYPNVTSRYKVFGKNTEDALCRGKFDNISPTHIISRRQLSLVGLLLSL